MPEPNRLLRPAPALVLAALLAAPAAAVEVPSGFVVEDAVPGAGFVVPVALAFFPAADGRMLVAEKQGRVWVVKNGVKRPTPMWQSQAEVLDEADRGLLGIAIDPDYVQNHYVYFLYTVDPDSNGNDNNGDGFGRLVRYRTSAADSNVVDPATRTILLGTSWADGPIIGSPSHSIGALRWGEDKSLLVSMGDGAQFNAMDPGGLDPEMFAPGVANPWEDIGAFRSQHLRILAGKVLRINRFTGHGYPSNPFWDGNPGSVRSRVWAYGLRNPFRFCVRPGTGSPDSSAGDPGTLYVGDVGWETWEEMNVARVGGRNFGWPCYEGIGEHSGYQGASPTMSGCDSIGNNYWNPNPVTSPIAAWHHYNGDLSVPPGVRANATTGGVYYTGTSYPVLYRNRMFIGDYAVHWIKVLVTDSNDNLISIEPFALDTEGAVEFQVDPASGDVHYISIYTFEVRRIRYTGGGGGNNPPVAVADASPTLGQPPLAVQFSSAGTFDPDLDPLGFQWTFGDGFGSTEPDPQHIYATNGTYVAVLTVTDGHGGLDRDSVTIVVSAPASFPTTGVLDDFNRANGPIGGQWTGLTTGLSINANALIHTGGYAAVVWNGAVFGPTQEAYFTVEAVTQTSPEHDLLLKVQGTTANAAHIEVRWDAVEGAVRVSTFAPGPGYVLRGGPYPLELDPGDQFGARAHPDGTVEVFVNGFPLAVADCSAWAFATGGGRLGMVFDNAVQSRMENFGGGNTVVGAPPVATIVTPADSSFYISGLAVKFEGSKSDPQDPPSSLTGQWLIRLHHNNHVHFEADLTGDTTTVIMVDHEDGTGTFYSGRYIVTDTGGLKDTAMVHMFPEVDLEPITLACVPANPGSTTETTYEFRIANHGRLQSRRTRWRLVAGNTMLAEGDTVVAPLDTIRVFRRLPPMLSVGPHTLRVVLDTLGVAVETNETNNARTIPIVVIGPPTAVDDPGGISLSPPHPNPTRAGVSLALHLPEAGPVEFEVLDLQGRVVWSAPSSTRAAGHVALAWSGRTSAGRRAPPGLYLARVRLGTAAVMVRRFVILD